MVAFEEHFWGDKYNGFDTLHTNYKQGLTATKEFLDFVKERATVEETYAKALQKLAHKCTTSFGHIGSFEPCWKFIQASTEKLSNVHQQIVTNFNELAKALKEYNDQQKDKQKHLKDEFNSMADLVTNIVTLNASLQKVKESYHARCSETDKSRKECLSLKEVPNLEKAENKMKRTSEEYKNCVDKREATRSEFQTKLSETSKKFESLEHDHLSEVLAYLGRYGNCLKTERVLLDQIIEEFSKNMDAFKVSSLMEQFVCAKETGKNIPAPIEFEEVQIATPPVDLLELASKDELKKKAKKERKTRKKKDKEKITANGNLQNQDDTQKNEHIKVDEDGYSIRPADPDSTSIRSSKSRDSFSSGSGSDSDDDEPKKIKVKIKPKEEIKHTDASIDALKSVTAGLTLSSPGTLQRKLNTGNGLDLTTKKLSRSNNALLDIEHSSNSDTASIKSLPSSSSLDTMQPAFLTSANTSKDNSLGDFDNLFETSAFNSSASINSDWATDFATGSTDAPKSSSETRQDDEETPPPLPAKSKAYQDEFSPLPRTRTLGNPSSSPHGSSHNLDSSTNVDKAVTLLPRLKTISGNQFPTLAPPASSRRNTTSSRPMHARPQPPIPQQPQQPQPQQPAQPAQSSLADLMDIFSAPPPLPAITSGPTAPQINTSAAQPLPASTSSPAKTADNVYLSSNNATTAVAALPRGEQQAQNTAAVNPNNTTANGTEPGAAAAAAVVPRPLSNGDRPTPFAVAFIETVNAYFKGADQSKLMTKITGDMTVSFPSTIIPVLVSQPAPIPLTFDISGTSSLEQIFPNKALVERESQLSGGDTMCFKFNMQALSSYLKKQSEQSAASFYNIDIIKYQVRSAGVKTIPLQLRPFWRCDPKTTDLKIDYELNHSCMKPPSDLSNVSVVVPVDGGVEIMHSKPSATWSGENQRAVWKLPVLSPNSDNKGIGSLRARFEVSKGPSTPVPIAIQFSCDTSTISNVKFELKSSAYKLSLVKRKFTTGKYLAEPIPIPEKS
eukprot:gene7862-8712_t